MIYHLQWESINDHGCGPSDPPQAKALGPESASYRELEQLHDRNTAFTVRIIGLMPEVRSLGPGSAS